MYSLAGYGEMIADRVRVEAYTQALRQTVRPGSVVVEIGTGPGIFAVLACQLGARRVYAIEMDSVIQVAREIAAANHFADRIVFMEDLSTQITLPERADVLVSDMRGVLPLLGRHIPSIADARRRFLAPGGTLIPKRDTVWVAVVEAPERYGQIVNCWEKNVFGQDLTPARRLAVNDIQKARLTPEHLLTRPQIWWTLDYASVESPDVCGTLNWTIERPGTAHGLLAWFEAELAEGIGFSNSPGLPEAIYGSMFFPWAEPVPLSRGQNLCVRLQAKLMETDYVWRWTTQIEPANGSGTVTRFEQSQLSAAVLSLAKLRKSASDYVPQITEEGRIRRRALELMDGQASLEHIARRLTVDFPQRFTRWQQALSYVGTLSQEYSR